MKNIEELEKKINLVFDNKDLLTNAFVHRSYLNENKKFHLPSNEKMEFLGDSVLSLATSIFLYKHYPQLEEGDYTEIKAAIVRTESLAEAAQALNLGEYFLLSKGQDQEGGRQNINILADCFEALIASIFLDKNFDEAYRFITGFLFTNKLDNIIKNKLYLSPKSRLQEFTQAKYKTIPDYVLLEEKGPEHDRDFKIVVVVNHQKMAIGVGKSKKQAEEEAAKNTLEKLHLIV
jgi:ribonuclease III